MKNILRDRYLWSIAGVFLIFMAYTYFQDGGKVSWLPSMITMPITNTAYDMGLFFSLIALCAFRFHMKGGIIAAVSAFPLLIWAHGNMLSQADTKVELLFVGLSGIIVALIVGGYVASKNKLQKALDEVKTLSGFLTIYAACKKIRNDKGYWQAVEHYIEEHSYAEFTHGICPDCAARLYPEISGQLDEKPVPCK